MIILYGVPFPKNLVKSYFCILFDFAVADSYDLWSFVENIVGKDLKELIESRPKPLIVRPDSGDPVQTLITVLNKLETSFGGVTTNAKGFKLLPPSLVLFNLKRLFQNFRIYVNIYFFYDSLLFMEME